MPKRTKELSAIEVKRLTDPGRHPVGTVPGLYLWVRDTGTKNWLLRAMVNGKRSDIGLGGYPAVSLADALKRARDLREGIAKGVDPLAKKKADKAAVMTFEKAAREYIKLHRPSWKNVKHGQQWENTLATYVYPTMGSLPVKDVETPHVLAVVQPHWNTKNETMVRVRNRIELVLSWAMAAGHRERGLNPATWRGHLDQALPKPSRVNGRTHHPALPWQELPALIHKLKSVEGMSARCLEFTILTACRSGEARGATWDEIDLKDSVWNIPAERMKAGKAHRVADRTGNSICQQQAMFGVHPERAHLAKCWRHEGSVFGLLEFLTQHGEVAAHKRQRSKVQQLATTPGILDKSLLGPRFRRQRRRLRLDASRHLR